MSIFASFVDESLPTDNGEMYCSLCQTQLKVGYYPDLQTRSDCVFTTFPLGTKLGRLLPVSRDEQDLNIELLSCKECCMDILSKTFLNKTIDCPKTFKIHNTGLTL